VRLISDIFSTRARLSLQFFVYNDFRTTTEDYKES
jgi:hypothetical protein